MKKLAVIFFFGALVLGVIGSQLFSFGRILDFGSFNFNFRGLKGSGNVVRERRDLSGFDELEVGGAFLLEVTVGESFSVEVEGDDNLVPLIKTEVRGDALHVSIDKGYRSKDYLKVYVSAPNLTGVDTSGAAQVNASGIKSTAFNIGSSGGSKVTVTGQTTDLRIETSGGAKVLANELAATNGTVDTSGGATAEVLVTGELKAHASGGSRIVYSGTPANVTKNSSGGARITQK